VAVGLLKNQTMKNKFSALLFFAMLFCFIVSAQQNQKTSSSVVLSQALTKR